MSGSCTLFITSVSLGCRWVVAGLSVGLPQSELELEVAALKEQVEAKSRELEERPLHAMDEDQRRAQLDKEIAQHRAAEER